mmetsp:Transcript_4262/g.12027  ORF Transcript_4262/g.12027 Transcript_4262/m.12027 type:complete len:211 (-) Transcript_4262:622-1254(-)
MLDFMSDCDCCVNPSYIVPFGFALCRVSCYNMQQTQPHRRPLLPREGRRFDRRSLGYRQSLQNVHGHPHLAIRRRGVARSGRHGAGTPSARCPQHISGIRRCYALPALVHDFWSAGLFQRPERDPLGCIFGSRIGVYHPGYRGCRRRDCAGSASWHWWVQLDKLHSAARDRRKRRWQACQRAVQRAHLRSTGHVSDEYGTAPQEQQRYCS